MGLAQGLADQPQQSQGEEQQKQKTFSFHKVSSFLLKKKWERLSE
jgi:hypothetical protein